MKNFDARIFSDKQIIICHATQNLYLKIFCLAFQMTHHCRPFFDPQTKSSYIDASQVQDML